MTDAEIVAVESAKFGGEWRNTAYTDVGTSMAFEGDRTVARAQADRSGLLAVREDAEHYRWERPGYFEKK